LKHICILPVSGGGEERVWVVEMWGRVFNIKQSFMYFILFLYLYLPYLHQPPAAKVPRIKIDSKIPGVRRVTSINRS
jgi:hypothetical protein